MSTLCFVFHTFTCFSFVSMKVCCVKVIVLAAPFFSIVTHGAVFFLALNEDFSATLLLGV